MNQDRNLPTESKDAPREGDASKVTAEGAEASVDLPIEEPDDEPEEFSLDQLTEAYAKFLGDQGFTKSEPTATDTALSRPDDDHADTGPELVEDEDERDNDGCPISPETIVEAILFVGAPKDVKLTSRKIAALLRDVSPKEVNRIVKDLNQRYVAEDAAYRIRNENGSLRMHLAESLTRFQQDFFGRNKPVRLSQAAIDVMAVVAYNQPVTKDQVETIRSKPSGSILSQLVRRKLIEVAPDENDVDRKRRYVTTEKFLDLFNLEEIGDLPQTHEASDIAELAD